MKRSFFIYLPKPKVAYELAHSTRPSLKGKSIDKIGNPKKKNDLLEIGSYNPMKVGEEPKRYNPALLFKNIHNMLT